MVFNHQPSGATGQPAYFVVSANASVTCTLPANGAPQYALVSVPASTRVFTVPYQFSSTPMYIAFSGEAASVKMPYMLLGIFLVGIAILFFVNKFPEFKEEEEGTSAGSLGDALKQKHLVWAVIAQLFYVGAQVCVTSFFVRMAISGGGVDEKTAGYYLGIYGLLFMVGRFAGTAMMRFIAPAKLLSLYSVACILLSLVAIYADGQYVVIALGGLGFFMSIMFPTIFSLGIKDMKENTKPASSLIVMAIIGGAIFPVIMGNIIDNANDNIQIGYTVPMVCFLVVLYFGLKGHQPKNA
jgi:FHS family L-fucose permease-like MFS transporter